MAGNTVLNDRWGIDFPLGAVQVGTPGTPVRITKNIDANNTNAPETQSNNTTYEWTTRFNQLMFQGYHPANNNNGLAINTGLVYILRWNAAGAGNGNRTDYGVMVAVLPAGNTLTLAAGAWVNDAWNPYRYGLDADVANEGALITGFAM